MLVRFSRAAALTAATMIFASATARAADPFSADLLRDRLWDDGKAEYDVYDAREVREGAPRPARVVILLVKEPFNARLGVKADRPPATDVIKMNQVIDVPTGVFAFHQMHSTFWDRATGGLVKFSLTSNDSCGNTFKEGRIGGGSLQLLFHTYWDGEADGERTIRVPEGGVFLDELPMKLRTLARFDPAEYTILLFPSVISSKMGNPAFAPATIRVLPAGPDGAIRVEVAHRAGVDRFVFQKALPHVLASWTRADGSTLRLKKSLRLDYWNHHAPGDEKLLE